MTGPPSQFREKRGSQRWFLGSRGQQFGGEGGSALALRLTVTCESVSRGEDEDPKSKGYVDNGGCGGCGAH